MRRKIKILFLLIYLLAFIVCLSPALIAGESTRSYSQNKWIGLAGNFDIGYRETQFFNPNHHVYVGTWDNRVELWLPPFRDNFSWGPYIRLAGISSSSKEAWENAWLAEPGLGFQIYPFSFQEFQQEDSIIGKVLGPLRLFAEYNWMDYWGAENVWRPDHQVRAGAEYWRNLHANDLNSPWWTEIWGGLYWQSANEFDSHYDTLNFALSFRSGVRAINSGIVSILSPYIMLESSYNKNETYYWENRFLVGGGMRVSPSKRNIPTWLNRIIIYAEYDYIAGYYHEDAPATVPDDDIRVGLTFSLGDWYH